MKVQITKIKPNPFQERKTFEDIGSLSMEMKKKGFWGSLLARETKDGKYEIAFGERRMRAAKAAGIKEVEIEVREMDDLEMRLLTTIENTSQSKVEPLERAEHLAELRNKYDWSERDIAKHTFLPLVTVHQYLELSGVLMRTAKSIKEKKIGWRVATDAEKVGGSKLVDTAIKQKLTHGDICEIKKTIQAAPDRKEELITGQIHPADLELERLKGKRAPIEEKGKEIVAHIRHCSRSLEYLGEIIGELSPQLRMEIAIAVGVHREQFKILWKKVAKKQLEKNVVKHLKTDK